MAQETEILTRLSAPLLRWYDENRRVLPWREEVSAYRTWVSEIMLQQTRVAAVLPYFERFMAAFPDVAALAAAEPDRLMKLWGTTAARGIFRRRRKSSRSSTAGSFRGRTTDSVPCRASATIRRGRFSPSRSVRPFPRSMATSCVSPRASRGAGSTFWTRRTAARSARGWPRR